MTPDNNSSQYEEAVTEDHLKNRYLVIKLFFSLSHYCYVSTKEIQILIY